MADLGAAIRAKLDSMIEDPGKSYQSCAGCEHDCRCQAYVDYQAALLAVLELHAYPAGSGVPGEIHCGELIDWVDGGCPTVRALAKTLGIDAG